MCTKPTDGENKDFFCIISSSQCSSFSSRGPSHPPKTKCFLKALFPHGFVK